MYEPTQLFFYKPVFMLELLVAELMFASKLERRRYFALRLAGSLAVCFGAAFAFPLASYSAYYVSFMFLCFFGVTVAALAFSFKASFHDIIFCAISGYTVQHVVQEMYELLNSATGVGNMLDLDFYGNDAADIAANKIFYVMLYYTVYFVAFALCYFVAYMVFARKIKKYDILRINTVTMTVIVAVILVLDVIFSAIATYSVPKDGNLVATVLLHIYNIACCILVLVLLYELPKSRKNEREIVAIRQLHEKEKEQYYESKENVELINIKCHDLKHQIRMIGEGNAVSSGAIAEIENIIDIYDATFTTDSEALNVILKEKSLICKKQSIRLACIVDSSKFGFVSDIDLYALFGNLLDNAIEAVKTLDAERRTIGLSVRAQNGIIRINVYNGYKGEIKFEGDLPITTKENKLYHGYGLKSIKRIVDKYDGEMSISTDNGIFEVNIVFEDRSPSQQCEI